LHIFELQTTADAVSSTAAPPSPTVSCTYVFIATVEAQAWSFYHLLRKWLSESYLHLCASVTKLYNLVPIKRGDLFCLGK